MTVTLMYFEGCPNFGLAVERLTEALDRLGKDPLAVEYVVVETPDDADRLGFRGSPTFLVDGRDLFADTSAPVGLACRVYDTEAGPQGVPAVEQLVDALRR